MSTYSTDTFDDIYFDRMTEGAVMDAWLMIQSDETPYETLEAVIINETTFSEDMLSQWADTEWPDIDTANGEV